MDIKRARRVKALDPLQPPREHKPLGSCTSVLQNTRIVSDAVKIKERDFKGVRAEADAPVLMIRDHPDDIETVRILFGKTKKIFKPRPAGSNCS